MDKEKIQEDLSRAIKQQNSLVTGVLRMVLAAISNKEKEKKYKEEKENLNKEELIEIISSEAKKRKEAILEYKKAGRKELLEKEKEELEILQKYLPEQLSEEELKNIVKGAIEEIGADSINNLGKVMAKVMPMVKGKADGNKVSQIAKKLLAQ